MQHAMYKLIHLSEKSLGFLHHNIEGDVSIFFGRVCGIQFQTFQNVRVEKVPMEMQLIH